MAACTYVGTYSLYSVNGQDISIDHEEGKLFADFDNTGLELGTFAPDQAIVATQDRMIGLGTAGSAANFGILNGDTLKVNGIAIAAARATDDTSSDADTNTTSSYKASSAIAIAAAINRSSSETGVTLQKRPQTL